MLVALLPVARPGHQHGVVFEASQPTGLEEVGGGVAQVGGDGHLTEALHLLGLHQFTEGLDGDTESSLLKGRDSRLSAI